MEINLNDRARAMFQAGLTKREIARHTGLTYSQVRRACDSRRVDGRTTLERERNRLLAEKPDCPEHRKIVLANF